LALSKKDFGGLINAGLAGNRGRFQSAKLCGHRAILSSTKLAKLFAFASFAPHGALPATHP
jgi:hypothetical protein